MRCAALLLLSGLSLACGISGQALAQAPGVIRPSPRDPYGDHIAEAAQRFELPAAWIRAVLAAESNGDPRAISPKGAMGLMQVMPQTWSDLRIRHRLGGDPYDPHDNIIAGAAYIRLLYDRYGSPGWIAAYNAGPGRYEASLKGRPLPPETRAYVATVAPNLDRAGDPGVTMVAAIDPLAWTRSALFVVQSDRQSERRSAADSVPAERPSSDASATPTVRDVSAIVPQSNGLFVARANGGTAP
jgi:soluble lytic murein transglycosylase-like protein